MSTWLFGMHVDLAVNLLKKTEQGLQSYRASGFSTAQMAAKDICKEIHVEAVLKQKRLRFTKPHFSYESHDEPFSDALRKLEIGFFSVVLDAALSAITERFTTLEIVENKLAVLTNFLQTRSWLSSAMHLAPHCTLKGILIWTVESFYRKSRTFLTMSLLELITST